MQHINEFKFYELACAVHPLTVLEGEVHLRDAWYSLFQARESLNQIFVERPLPITLDTATKLYQAILEVVPKDLLGVLNRLPKADELAANPNADLITTLQLNSIRDLAKQFETVLSAEVQALDTYHVSQKGSYSTRDLIERAEIVFPESIRQKLPDMTIADIKQAGRCIALDTPTGAAFHLMRAIEGVMSIYYAQVLGAPIPTRMRNWGVYIKNLRNSGKADARILNFLDHIRENYRNPITHPEAMVDGDEAEILLGVAVSAIRQMIIEIKRLEAAASAIVTTATAPTLAISAPPPAPSLTP